MGGGGGLKKWNITQLLRNLFPSSTTGILYFCTFVGWSSFVGWMVIDCFSKLSNHQIALLRIIQPSYCTSLNYPTFILHFSELSNLQIPLSIQLFLCAQNAFWLVFSFPNTYNTSYMQPEPNICSQNWFLRRNPNLFFLNSQYLTIFLKYKPLIFFL